MSRTMKSVNSIVMFFLVFVLLETIFVRMFLAPPTGSAQWLSTILTILILAWILFALYIYQKRGSKKIAVITLLVLGGYIFIKGLYYILTTGNLIVRQGHVFQVYLGNIVLGIFFLIYAFVIWRSNPKPLLAPKTGRDLPSNT